MKFALLVLLLSYVFAESEALRYARHGCEVENSEKGCRALKRLEKLKAHEPEKTTFKVKKDFKDKEISLNVSIDNSLLDMIVLKCPDYRENLLSCTPYSCSYKEPFAEKDYSIEIIKKSNERCLTKENKLDSGLITCRFKKEDLEFSAAMIESKWQKYPEKLEQWYEDGTCVFSDN